MLLLVVGPSCAPGEGEGVGEFENEELRVYLDRGVLTGPSVVVVHMPLLRFGRLQL